MKSASPVLVGYALKCTLKRSDSAASSVPFPAPPPVEEIGSVSHCISKGPERWTRRYTANEFGLHASPAAAWASVWVRDRPQFDLYAFGLFPSKFSEAGSEGVDLPEPAAESLPPSFVRLGFDVVEISEGFGFGCSPLSCNYQAGQLGIPKVNRYCLLRTRPAAFALAHRFAVAKPEPGPYVVVEVWRDEKGVLDHDCARSGRLDPGRG